VPTRLGLNCRHHSAVLVLDAKFNIGDSVLVIVYFNYWAARVFSSPLITKVCEFSACVMHLSPQISVGKCALSQNSHVCAFQSWPFM